MQIYRLEQEKLHPVSPEQAFPFLGEKKHIISLVGGGGKTTLLYALAGYYRAKGWRTAVTTTTHIAHPALQWRGKERSTDLETDCAQNASERAAEKERYSM